MNGSRTGMMVGVVGGWVLLACGCNQSNHSDSRTSQPATAVVSESPSHEHGEWWCDEHGVPEEECTRCRPDLTAGYKKKGDWCGKHDRPDSQCFLCHPEKEAQFAARYKIKYGKLPPKPVED